MSVVSWAGVLAFGALGALARFRLDGFVQRASSWGFPLGTLVVNLSGAFVLGLFAGAALRGTSLELAGTAGIGSYTTFSTWMLETERLSEDGDLGLAALNVVASVALGVAIAALGWWIGEAL
jgi:fluoride exporter